MMNNFGNVKKWYVFYTFAKFERKIHEYLQQNNYESFLPLRWTVRQWSDRKKRMEVPLFPSYIFINIESSRIFEILDIPKVLCTVNFNKTPAFLKQEEINNIKRIVENDHAFEVCCDLKIGDSVVIVKGALNGMEGILVEERGSHRFAIKLESLRQSVLVNIPIENLELAEAFV